jgi:hypothetical protein
MIENHEIGLTGRHHVADLIDLTLAGIGFGIGTLAPTEHFSDNNAASRLGEQANLFQLILDIGLTEVELNDHRAFTGGGSFNHGRFREKEEALAHPCGGLLNKGRLFGRLFLLEVHRTSRNHRGDGMLVDHLGNRVLEQNDVLVERLNLALQLYAINQINRNGDMLATKSIEEGVL